MIKDSNIASDARIALSKLANVSVANVFYVGYVDNTSLASDTDGAGLTPTVPFKTIDYAIGKCTAGKGDTIYVLPGHVESVSSATGMVLDVSGVSIIGLGRGPLRPTITLDTANTATISVTASGCSIENCIFVNNFLDIASTFTLAATADGFLLKDCTIRDTSIILGALKGISIAAACSDVTIDGLSYEGQVLTNLATHCIICAGAADRFKLINSYIQGSFTTATVIAAVAASADVVFRDLHICNSHATTSVGISLHAGTTGYADRYVYFGGTNTEKGLVATLVQVSKDCNYTNALAAHAGLFCVAVDS